MIDQTHEINDGHYFELMDRIHVITCNINDHVLEHPLTEKLDNVKKLIDEAIDKLSEAYQLIGQTLPDKEHE